MMELSTQLDELAVLSEKAFFLLTRNFGEVMRLQAIQQLQIR